MRFCPDCGGAMFYDKETKEYVCNSCGASYTIQELTVRKERELALKYEGEKKKRQKEEYLEWWLSKKK
ncbi:MAG: FYDLN acid domain-containing protein [Nitrososphaerota archaeon]